VGLNRVDLRFQLGRRNLLGLVPLIEEDLDFAFFIQSTNLSASTSAKAFSGMLALSITCMTTLVPGSICKMYNPSEY